MNSNKNNKGNKMKNKMKKMFEFLCMMYVYYYIAN